LFGNFVPWDLLDEEGGNCFEREFGDSEFFFPFVEEEVKRT
jgi:hypothetical protein